MLVLGLSGGLDAIEEQYFNPYPINSHDSAAVLIEDGSIVAGIETERLNRIKHTNKFPVEAIEFCLGERGVSLSDVDRIAYYWDHDHMGYRSRGLGPRRYTNALEVFAHIFQNRFGVGMKGRLRFVNHHTSHTVSAAAFSGLEEGLVCSMDGRGDTDAGLISVFTPRVCNTKRCASSFTNRR